MNASRSNMIDLPHCTSAHGAAKDVFTSKHNPCQVRFLSGRSDA